ncbi:MAG: glycosyltransferase [Planctomycetota bacterium]
MTLAPSTNPAVISVHGPHALSGVTTWAARMAGNDGPLAHQMVIVRRESDPTIDARFPGAGTPGFDVLTIADDATVADGVLAIADRFASAGPAIALVHDHLPAAVAAAIVGRDDFGIASISHADEPRYEELFDRIGGLLDVWWGDSKDACRRAMTDACAHACAGAFPGGAPRVEDPTLPPGSFDASRPTRLLWLGRVERYQKRALDAVAVTKCLADAGVDAKMTIAGDGPALAEVRERIGTLGLRTRCEAIGVVEPAGVPDLLREHDALVMTSAFEGTPVAAAEAAHHGCALFITEGCGGLLDLAREGEAGVTPIGACGLQARAVADAVVRPGALRELGNAALGLARRDLDQATIRVAMDCALQDAFAKRPPFRVEEKWNQVLRAMEGIGGVTERDVRSVRAWYVTEHRGVNADALGVRMPGVPCLEERLVRRAVGELTGTGVSRIALYGAGRHTRAASGALHDLRALTVVIDDSAAGGDSIEGVPVVHPDDPRALDAEAVIVSSSEYEEAMADRARAWADGRRVVPLYAPLHQETGASA